MGNWFTRVKNNRIIKGKIVCLVERTDCWLNYFSYIIESNKTMCYLNNHFPVFKTEL